MCYNDTKSPGEGHHREDFDMDMTREEMLKRGFPELPNECWEFSLKVNESGRCFITIDGKRDTVPRHAFRHHIGEIPAGYVVRNICEKPNCFNFNHGRLYTKDEWRAYQLSLVPKFVTDDASSSTPSLQPDPYEVFGFMQFAQKRDDGLVKYFRKEYDIETFVVEWRKNRLRLGQKENA